eukprot:gene7599-1357_t
MCIRRFPQSAPKPAGGHQQQQGGYGRPPPQQGGYGQPPQQGGYGGPPPPQAPPTHQQNQLRQYFDYVDKVMPPIPLFICPTLAIHRDHQRPQPLCSSLARQAPLPRLGLAQTYFESYTTTVSWPIAAVSVLHPTQDRSGHIDAEELSGALSTFNAKFAIEACRWMIRMFDKDGNGTIDFGEYVQLHGYLNQPGCTWFYARSLCAAAAALLWAHSTMMAAFDQIDTDKSGGLQQAEVERAIVTSGYQLPPQCHQILFRKFDRNRRGQLDRAGYIELCCFLGTAKNVFMPYDVQRNGFAQFSFDQFLVVASQLSG